MTSAVAPFDDIAPVSDELTEYDRAHIKLYMRLPMRPMMGRNGPKSLMFCSELILFGNLNAPGRSMTAIWDGRAG